MKVNWGALGQDLIAFAKATRRYESASKTIVGLNDFPDDILKVIIDLTLL